ncbi:hypothetical protein Q31b_25660 [Novipirellula aureliae]|uniref:Right handed beta helix domain-containing protein n=1 Tax=Novipirellula aureliae TaxID=2527966 RepID=A0A5C6E4C7_9BACT|nr:PDZ domain-containing protein [Novipirellula aureliae]TWU43525.1 hypothetical protein Q31b_25660 [Novipirellula aureliae]
MRRLYGGVVGLLFLGCSVFAEEIHVAANGNDMNKGTLSSPLATLGAAQDALRQTGRLGKEPCAVVIHAGTYRLSKPLVLGPADCGSEDAPVVYRAAVDEDVVITGAQRITSAWEAWKDRIVRTQLGKTEAIDQFFVNGERQHMARYPNHGAGFVPAGGNSERGARAGTPPYTGCTPDAWDDSRAAGWIDPTGAFMHGMHGGLWGSQHYRVLGKNANGSLNYEGGWQNNRAGKPHASYRMIENVFEELDAPGEWFHDTKQGYLYYQPAKNVDMASASFEAVQQIKHLIEIYGDTQQPVAEMDILNSGNRLEHTLVKTYETTRPVKNIRIEGIRFTGTARTFMETREPLLRSDWSIYRGGAVHLRGTEAIVIERCDFEELGGNAVFVDGYNRNVTVRSNRFKNNGASDLNFVGSFAAVRDPAFSHGASARPLDEVDTAIGPKSDEYPADCLVEDNLMTLCGRFEKQTSGVNLSMSSRITIRHNTISHTPRAAINICDGTWGGHLLEWNDCFETVLETHDHGAFNSWGRDRYWHRAGTSGPSEKDKDGIPMITHWINRYPNCPRWDAYQTTIIRSNRMHCDHGWSIDLDDGSTNYQVYNNLCLTGGLKTREGYYRTFTNNVVIGNVYTCNVPYPKPTHDQYERNLMWGKGYQSTKPLLWGGTRNYNFLHGPDATETGPATALQDQSRDDPDSLYGNARFLSPEEGDFRVASDSPALRIGFQNFPMTGFGVTSARRKAQAAFPTIRMPEVYVTNEMEEFVTNESRPVRGGGRRGDRGPVRVRTKQVLGADVKSLTTDGEVSAAGMYSKSGVILLTVAPKSQMALFGFRDDDVVLEIDGIEISDDDHLINRMQNLVAGEHTAKVWRAQEPLTLSFIK